MIAAIIDNNYERIRADLVGRGLTYERLIDDLLDHVCCMVEEYMQQGSDFDTSYDRVLDSIEDKRLPELQHQTLLNLDKKFQRMKNFTYLFGLTSAILTIVGAFFKKMHWPGASILITVGIAMVVLVFLPLYFITNYREQAEKKNPVYAIVGYLTLALMLAGALFKIMHWPGANIMIKTGLGFLIIGFIPLYVVNAFQRGGSEKVRLPYIVMLMVGISIVVLFSNVRMSKYAINIYLEETAYIEHDLGEIAAQNTRFLDMTQDSAYAHKREQVLRIQDQAGELQVVIDEMRESLLESVGQPGVSIQEVKKKDRRRRGWGPGLDYDQEEAFVKSAKQFKEMLDEMLLDPVIRSQIDGHLEFTKKVWPYEFGARVIVGNPLIINYYMLSKMSKGIALTEFVAIEYLLRH